jgi:hypothetical protein
MSDTAWQITGDYCETCNCDFLCPCITSNMADAPTNGDCNFAMVFHIDSGRYGDTDLANLNFAMIGHTPDIMGKGDWSVGLITDERASAEQQQALTAIASGQAGGPPAGLAPLLGKFLGVESKAIEFHKNGMSYSALIPGLLDEACEGVPSAVSPGEPLYLDNTLHPANKRLGIARATRSHLHAFGLDWDDTSGRNGGHFASFDWRDS